MSVAEELDKVYCFTVEAAKIIGINTDTVKRLARQHKIPARRWREDHDYVFKREDVLAFKATYQKPSSPPPMYGKPCLWCDRKFGIDTTTIGTIVKHLARGLCQTCYSTIRETYLKHGESF